MELITKKQKIDGVYRRWMNQYPNDKDGKGVQLLKEKPKTEEHVCRIIGNNSWTDNHCSQCNDDVDKLVHVGDNMEYDGENARICLKCLTEATELINGV